MRPPTADLGARTASTSTSVANLGSFLSTGLAGDAATAADDADADANQPDAADDGRESRRGRRWHGERIVEDLVSGPEARTPGRPARIALTAATRPTRTAVVDMPPTFGRVAE